MKTRGQATSITAKRRGIGLGLLLTVLAISGYFLRDRHANFTRPAEVVTEQPPFHAAVAPENGEATATRLATNPKGRDVLLPAVIHAHQAEAHPPSHPIDAQRQRIYRENSFQAALMSAMNQSDVRGLRAVVAEYRAEYPEDEFDLQEGYTLVANCMDQLTAERQERARHYWRTKRSSTVRRFIRRHCLERQVSTG